MERDCWSNLRISTTLNNVVMNLTKLKDGGWSFEGMEATFLGIILKAVKANFTFVYPEDSVPGIVSPDGNWSGVIGTLQRDEADIGVQGLADTYERRSVVDFSTPYTMDDVTFFAERPGHLSTSDTILYPLTVSVWIALAFTLILMPPLLFFLLDGPQSVLRIYLRAFGSILKQPLDIRGGSFRNGLLISAWWFLAVVISFSYSAVLLSFLTFPAEMPYVKDFRELSEAIKKGTHQCIARVGTKILQMLIDSEQDNLKYIGNSVMKHKWGDAADPNLVPIYLYSRKFSKLVTLDDFHSRFYTSTDSIGFLSAAIAMKKNFCGKRRLNSIVSRVNSAGLYGKAFRDTEFKTWLNHIKTEGIEELKGTSGFKILSVNDMYGPLTVLGAGYIISFITLIFELIIFKSGKISNWFSSKLRKHKNLRKNP